MERKRKHDLMSLDGLVAVSDFLICPCDSHDLPDVDLFEEYQLGLCRDYLWKPEYDGLLVYFVVENLRFGKDDAEDICGNLWLETECLGGVVFHCPWDMYLIEMPKDCAKMGFIHLVPMSFKGIDMYNFFRMYITDGVSELASHFLRFMRPTVKKIAPEEWFKPGAAGVLNADGQLMASCGNKKEKTFTIRAYLPANIPIQFLPEVQVVFYTEYESRSSYEDVWNVANRRNSVYVEAEFELDDEADQRGAIMVEIYSFEHLVSRFFFHTDKSLEGAWTADEVLAAMEEDYEYYVSYEEYYRQLAAKHR